MLPAIAKETAVIKAFTDHKLFYPVPITKVNASPLKGFPWLKPGDFLQTLAKYNDLAHVLGGFASFDDATPMLQTFWDRYRAVHPHFTLFTHTDAGRIDLKKCFPLYIHGDEGTTYKRSGILIMSFQSPLGFGTSRRPQEMSLNLQNMGESGLPLNFLKCGMYSRMLMASCPKDTGFFW